MKKLLLTISVLFFCFLKVEAAHDLRIETVFLSDNWAKVPVPRGITPDTFPGLLESRELNFGRYTWKLEAVNTADLDGILAGEYEATLVRDKTMFARPAFEVDKAFKIRYSLFLVSKHEAASALPEDDGAGKMAVFHLVSELNSPETDNSIVHALRMPMTFEEAAALAEADAGEFESTIAAEQREKLKRFMTPAGLLRYEVELASEKRKIEEGRPELGA